MDPKKWINVSHEADVSLDSEVIQTYEENMGREGYAIEAGDKLPPYGHWFISMKKNQPEDKLNIPASHNLYWYSGKILFESPLILGDNCTQKLQIRKVEKMDGTDTSHLITVGHKLVSAGKPAIDEEQILLLTDQIEPHKMVRRIHFDPDWKQDVKPEMIASIRAMSSKFFENPVIDLFTKTGKDQGQSLDTGGSPAMILLMESFNNNFESRVIDRISYKSFSYSFEDELSIAGQDSDSFVTSLRIINSKNQVLYSADIRWSYSWS